MIKNKIDEIFQINEKTLIFREKENIKAII